MKEMPFLKKMVYKRVRVGSRGGASSYKTFLRNPSPGCKSADKGVHIIRKRIIFNLSFTPKWWYFPVMSSQMLLTSNIPYKILSTTVQHKEKNREKQLTTSNSKPYHDN